MRTTTFATLREILMTWAIFWLVIRFFHGFFPARSRVCVMTLYNLALLD